MLRGRWQQGSMLKRAICTAAVPPVHMSLQECHNLCLRALIHSGMNSSSAEIIAGVITAAERDEARSHGLFRLPGFCRALQSGRVPGDLVPSVRDAAPGVVLVDAKGGFAPIALSVGIPLLIEKAKSQGVAVMGLTRSIHYSALWWETEQLAAAGLVGFSFVNSKAFVAPFGSHQRIFGTNPMSFPWHQPSPILTLNPMGGLLRGHALAQIPWCGIKHPPKWRVAIYSSLNKLGNRSLKA